VYESTLYTLYMFQPLMWPSSGRCITRIYTSKYYRSIWTNAQI